MKNRAGSYTQIFFCKQRPTCSSFFFSTHYHVKNWCSIETLISIEMQGKLNYFHNQIFSGFSAVSSRLWLLLPIFCLIYFQFKSLQHFPLPPSFPTSFPLVSTYLDINHSHTNTNTSLHMRNLFLITPWPLDTASTLISQSFHGATHVLRRGATSLIKPSDRPQWCISCFAVLRFLFSPSAGRSIPVSVREGAWGCYLDVYVQFQSRSEVVEFCLRV